MKIKSLVFFIGCALVASQVDATEFLFESEYQSISVEEDLRVYSPVDVSWDGNGLGYLLCQGSCTVMVFNEKMEIISAFGECGEGPGELGQVKTIEVVGSEVFVFQNHRLDIFDTSGNYKIRKTLPINITDTAILDNRFIVTSQDGGHLLSTFDLHGNEMGETGPLCTGETWDEKFAQCSGYRISGKNLIDFISGTVFQYTATEWKTSDWGLPSGKIWNEGGAVYTRGFISACCEISPQGDTIVAHRDPDENEAVYLSVVSQGQTAKIFGELDPESQIRHMEVSPSGRLWVLYWDSEVRIFGENYLKTIQINQWVE